MACVLTSNEHPRQNKSVLKGKSFKFNRFSYDVLKLNKVEIRKEAYPDVDETFLNVKLIDSVIDELVRKVAVGGDAFVQARWRYLEVWNTFGFINAMHFHFSLKIST